MAGRDGYLLVGAIAGHLPLAVDSQTARTAGRIGLHIVVVVVSAIIVTVMQRVVYIIVAVVKIM